MLLEKTISLMYKKMNWKLIHQKYIIIGLILYIKNNTVLIQSVKTDKTTK
jgi:hypothetical protein